MPEPCWIICPLVLLCWKQRNMVISEGLERDPCGFDLGVPWLFVLPLDGCLFYWVSGVSFIFGDRPFVRHVLCSVLFHSTCCLFILVIVSFAGQKPFHLMSCLSVCFCCLIANISLPMQEFIAETCLSPSSALHGNFSQVESYSLLCRSSLKYPKTAKAPRALPRNWDI